MNTHLPGRADARRNHEQVIAAAARLFAEHGTQASVPQIAEAAQVGKATVYRSFATKEDLIEAITNLRLNELQHRTAAARHHPDPAEALHRYVRELFDTLARDRLLTERLSDPTATAAALLLEQLGTLLEAARAAGCVRADATVLDLRVVLCGAALQLGRLGERDPAVWARYAEMVLAALR